ncbi:hypothetical protein STIAU_4294 [Stigmatella aurantiaca DW4/3-1]|uniref:Uncharacterized protein n=1 Tax=Stigmatella aurantiaca (strain DW4/3-1) TaxID=378806 RepID=Q092M2_STIAD|nr:hypothetical protein STIAU_4294 [Stigmatella aurantiaca DW4/3-1]
MAPLYRSRQQPAPLAVRRRGRPGQDPPAVERGGTLGLSCLLPCPRGGLERAAVPLRDGAHQGKPVLPRPGHGHGQRHPVEQGAAEPALVACIEQHLGTFARGDQPGEGHLVAEQGAHGHAVHLQPGLRFLPGPHVRFQRVDAKLPEQPPQQFTRDVLREGDELLFVVDGLAAAKLDQRVVPARRCRQQRAREDRASLRSQHLPEGFQTRASVSDDGLGPDGPARSGPRGRRHVLRQQREVIPRAVAHLWRYENHRGDGDEALLPRGGKVGREEGAQAERRRRRQRERTRLGVLIPQSHPRREEQQEQPRSLRAEHAQPGAQWAEGEPVALVQPGEAEPCIVDERLGSPHPRGVQQPQPGGPRAPGQSTGHASPQPVGQGDQQKEATHHGGPGDTLFPPHHHQDVREPVQAAHRQREAEHAPPLESLPRPWAPGQRMEVAREPRHEPEHVDGKDEYPVRRGPHQHAPEAGCRVRCPRPLAASTQASPESNARNGPSAYRWARSAASHSASSTRAPSRCTRCATPRRCRAWWACPATPCRSLPWGPSPCR